MITSSKILDQRDAGFLSTPRHSGRYPWGSGDNPYGCTLYRAIHCTFVPSIKKVIFNPPATIILWEDGTKTVVKTRKGTEFNPYYGFTAAVTKKVCGSNSRVNDFVEHAEWCHKEEK